MKNRKRFAAVVKYPAQVVAETRRGKTSKDTAGAAPASGAARTNSSYFSKILLKSTSIIQFLHVRGRERALLPKYRDGRASQIIRSIMHSATETIVIQNAACSLCTWCLQHFITLLISQNLQLRAVVPTKTAPIHGIRKKKVLSLGSSH